MVLEMVVWCHGGTVSFYLFYLLYTTWWFLTEVCSLMDIKGLYQLHLSTLFSQRYVFPNFLTYVSVNWFLIRPPAHLSWWILSLPSSWSSLTLFLVLKPLLFRCFVFDYLKFILLFWWNKPSNNFLR